MVLVYRSNHSYDFDFTTTSLAFFNKYPNPFSGHVISADTIKHTVDEQGRLHVERLIRKKGRLPSFVRPFLGSISDAWILETSIVDPSTCTLTSWTRNLDHKLFLQVNDVTKYTAANLTVGRVSAEHSMSFVSSFGKWGIKDKIENWSYSQCKERLMRSRQGMSYVMEQLRARGMNTFSKMQAAGIGFQNEMEPN